MTSVRVVGWWSVVVVAMSLEVQGMAVVYCYMVVVKMAVRKTKGSGCEVLLLAWAWEDVFLTLVVSMDMASVTIVRAVGWWRGLVMAVSLEVQGMAVVYCSMIVVMMDVRKTKGSACEVLLLAWEDVYLPLVVSMAMVSMTTVRAVGWWCGVAVMVAVSLEVQGMAVVYCSMVVACAGSACEVLRFHRKCADSQQQY
ncbi:hypothetical protein V5799_031369 [Amblyomma americanum]|uniref:Uncharacterized protein n=1 Tax=Amblyomma americanum TaxID=6943 RepID=A0AAQ4EKI9_AMBAM